MRFARGSPHRIILATAIEATVVLALHLLLLHLMAGLGIVATLLAAGPHLPVGSLFVAAAFVALRLLALLWLPGFVLYRLVQLGFSLWGRRRARME